jgi:Sec-independent protein translocase protein TatA
VGTDLGEAVKGFKKGVREGEPEQTSTDDASVKRIGGADAQSAPSGSRQHPPPA